MTPSPSPTETPSSTAGQTLTSRAALWVQRSHFTALVTVLGLIALGLAWELWLAPLRPGGSWWAIKVLPLLAMLPGLWAKRLYTHRALSLLLWLYVCEGLVRATTESGWSMTLAWGQVALGVLLFIAVSVHVRARLQLMKLEAS